VGEEGKELQRFAFLFFSLKSQNTLRYHRKCDVPKFANSDITTHPIPESMSSQARTYDPELMAAAEVRWATEA
jgi:hypothetical protein